ncbi:MAG: hypothetical protein FWG25_03550 [Promicromonosporaceae bacterium]|nr:hypothetical protein [Promicromonosporaceae bacterium]
MTVRPILLLDIDGVISPLPYPTGGDREIIPIRYLTSERVLADLNGNVLLDWLGKPLPYWLLACQLLADGSLPTDDEGYILDKERHFQPYRFGCKETGGPIPRLPIADLPPELGVIPPPKRALPTKPVKAAETKWVDHNGGWKGTRWANSVADHYFIRNMAYDTAISSLVLESVSPLAEYADITWLTTWDVIPNQLRKIEEALRSYWDDDGEPWAIADRGVERMLFGGPPSIDTKRQVVNRILEEHPGRRVVWVDDDADLPSDGWLTVVKPHSLIGLESHHLEEISFAIGAPVFCDKCWVEKPATGHECPA